MRDEELRQALGRLPSASAPAGFTEAVLDRLERPRTGVLRLALATAALVAVLVGGALWIQGQHQERRRQAELAALEQECRSLGRELQDIREKAPRPPLVYLGGEKVNVLYDPAGARPGGIALASGPTY